MRLYHLAALAALLLTAADSPKGDLDALQGEWLLIPKHKVVKQDRPMPVVKLVVKGNQHITLSDGKPTTSLPYWFEIDASTNPKTISHYYYDRKLTHGIYELKGDSLRICSTRISNPLPQQFNRETREYTRMK